MPKPFLLLVLTVAPLAAAGFTLIPRPQNVEMKLAVDGVCGMCRYRIEETAMSVKGVHAADWDPELRLLTVTVDPDIQASPRLLQQTLAEAGHDTSGPKAEDAVYESLPGCCRYRQ